MDEGTDMIEDVEVISKAKTIQSDEDFWRAESFVRDANTRNRILGRSARLDLKRTSHGHLLDTGMEGHGAIHVATRAEVLLFIDGCSWGAENQHRWSEVEVRESGDQSWNVVEACRHVPGTGTVYATYSRREWAHAFMAGIVRSRRIQ